MSWTHLRARGGSTAAPAARRAFFPKVKHEGMITPLSRNMCRIAHMATPAPTGCSCCYAQRKSRRPEGHGDGNFLVLLLRNVCFRLPHCRPAHSCRPSKEGKALASACGRLHGRPRVQYSSTTVVGEMDGHGYTVTVFVTVQLYSIYIRAQGLEEVHGSRPRRHGSGAFREPWLPS